MSWLIEKDMRFEASHQLPSHDGACARLHGHSWRATIRIEGAELQAGGPQRGMVLDYGRVTAALHPLLEQLDHRHLNELLENPTSEELARWLYRAVRAMLPVHSVTVEETCTCRCTYHE
jgi:6-pyruvoyltetrahydropterin/6-carboxytetrahydropterin synthase